MHSWFGILLGAIISSSALADEGPLLQLDAGGHMATIGSLAFTPDGKQLVSAGDDKVIRVWDLESGKTVRAMRGESALGNLGQISAIALSPDGKWLAAGGNFEATTGTKLDKKSQSIRLYDFESGKIVALLTGHTGVVRALAFSPSGKKLISGSSDNTAIIWDTDVYPGHTPQPKLLHRLEGHKADIFAVAFSRDEERAVTGSYDKTLTIWRVSDGKKIALLAGHSGKVMSLAVAPDGTIASGDIAGALLLWDGRDGHFLRVLAQQKMGAGSLGFSPNGKLLLSTCGFVVCAGAPVFVYDVAARKRIVSYTGHDNVVLASAFSPDGQWVATGGGTNNEIQLWDPLTGKRRISSSGKPLRLGGQGQVAWAASFSADGRKIGWGNVDACPQQSHCPNQQIILQRALALPLGDIALADPTALTKDDENTFRRASVDLDGWSLRHRAGGNYGYDNARLDILKAGHVVASITRGQANGLAHHAYSFTPDGKTIISGGSDGVITAYDLQGRALGAFLGHDGNVFAVSPSPDGRYLVTASADGTVRLWSLKTRELIVTLFSGADDEWVMWTPQGYYTGSPGADRMVGWQINRGPDKAADYVTAEQLRKQFNRPDIVTKAIQFASAEEAVRTSEGTQFRLQDLLAHPAPHLRILSPAPNSTINQADSLTLKIAFDAPPDPVTHIRILVNKRLFEERGANYSTDFAPGEHEFQVPVRQGKNTVVFTTYNATGWSNEQDGTLTFTNETSGPLDTRGTLYIVAIGVSRYPKANSIYGDLKFAGLDASAFAKEMEKRLGPLHKAVVPPIVLVNKNEEEMPRKDDSQSNENPDRGHILDAIGSIRTKSTLYDTVAIFLSGHGDNDGRYYHFLPTDAVADADRIRPSTVLTWSDIQEQIENTKGLRLLFVDTCHSGHAYNQLLSNQAYHADILAYSSSGPGQLAWEGNGHGFFTQALLEGLDGKARNGAGGVDTETLYDYIKTRVSKLAKAMDPPRDQIPEFYKGRDAEKYPLALPNPN